MIKSRPKANQLLWSNERASMARAHENLPSSSVSTTGLEQWSSLQVFTFFHRPYTAGEFDSVCRWRLLLSVMLQEVDIIKKCQNKMKRLLEKVDIQLKYVALILRHSTLTAPWFRHCSIDNNVRKRAELQRAANDLLYTRSLYTEK